MAAERQRRRERADVYSIRGYEVLKKVVTRSGRVGRVYVPGEWVGKTVKVVRID